MDGIQVVGPARREPAGTPVKCPVHFLSVEARPVPASSFCQIP